MQVVRTAFAFADFKVEAPNADAAESMALEMAGNHAFSEKGADYTIDDMTVEPAVKMTFESIMERDRYLRRKFPYMKPLEHSGAYKVRKGEITVNGETVVFRSTARSAQQRKSATAGLER